jgi:GAF domain-containing protein
MQQEIDLTKIENLIRLAALEPEKRNERIIAALQAMMQGATAIALILGQHDRENPWNVYAEPQRVEPWLQKSLKSRPSIERMKTLLQKTPAGLATSTSQPARPTFVELAYGARRSLLIIWTPSLSEVVLQEFKSLLETLMEVETKEDFYLNPRFSSLFEPDLNEYLCQDNLGAWAALLAQARLITSADAALWGWTYYREVRIAYTSGLERRKLMTEETKGKGIAGRMLNTKSAIVIPDFQHSQYRDSDLREVLDEKEVMSVLALPASGGEGGKKLSGVLYLLRSNGLPPFSLADRWLAERILLTVGPLQHR